MLLASWATVVVAQSSTTAVARPAVIVPTTVNASAAMPVGNLGGSLYVPTVNQNFVPPPAGGALSPSGVGGTMMPGPVGGALAPGNLPGTPAAVRVTGGFSGGFNNGSAAFNQTIAVPPPQPVIVTGAGGTLNANGVGGANSSSSVIVTGASSAPAGGSLGSGGVGGTLSSSNRFAPR